MKRVEFVIFSIVRFLASILPFRWIYALSDVMSFAVQHIIRYRADTVEKNLRQSFPNKSNGEINKITRNFYRNICDITLESIKGYSLTVDELVLRYRCLNPEVANDYFRLGRSVIIALSHYANWEWGTQVAGTLFQHQTISLYKPLSNKYIDDYVRAHRMIRGMRLCSVYQNKFIFHAKDNLPKAYFLVSDQNPSSTKKAYWLRFLNQDTACIQGIEGYARLYNFPVLYADIQRVERGRYTIDLEVMCDNPRNTLPGEITELYMKRLEEIIIAKPEDWLWSHKRWKTKRPMDALVDFRISCAETF